jgi:hypothetical protein
MTAEPSTAELIKLIEREQDSASEFIKSVVGTSFTIRGWAVTTWAALLGIAADQSSWKFALFALLAVAGFAFVDAYHSWIYGLGLRYVTSLEALMASYYKSMIRAKSDPDVELDFQVDLRQFKFGLFSQMPRFGLRELRRARPRWFFLVFYPALVAIAVAVIALTA